MRTVPSDHLQCSIGTTVGRILPGWLSDRIGRFNVMFGLSTLSGILVTVWWLMLNYYPSVAGIVLFALAYGVACGGFLSLVSLCVADLSGNRIEELGTDLGVCYVALAFGYVSCIKRCKVIYAQLTTPPDLSPDCPLEELSRIQLPATLLPD